jgi:hypothetical protein
LSVLPANRNNPVFSLRYGSGEGAGLLPMAQSHR